MRRDVLLFIAGVVFVLIVAALFWSCGALPGGPELLPTEPGVTNFTNVKASANVTAGGDLAAGDDLFVNDDATITDTLTVSNNAQLAKVTAPAGTTITVTDGSTITPTAFYQPLTAAAAVGTSSIATLAAGRLLFLVNIGSNAITITDTGALTLTGNIALGQYDGLLLLSDGNGWIQVAGAANN